MDIDSLVSMGIVGDITKMTDEDLTECVRLLRHSRTDPDVVEKVVARTKGKKDIALAKQISALGPEAMAKLVAMLGA